MFKLTKQTNVPGRTMSGTAYNGSCTSLFSHFARCLSLLLLLVIGQGAWAEDVYKTLSANVYYDNSAYSAATSTNVANVNYATYTFSNTNTNSCKDQNWYTLTGSWNENTKQTINLSTEGFLTNTTSTFVTLKISTSNYLVFHVTNCKGVAICGKAEKADRYIDLSVTEKGSTTEVGEVQSISDYSNYTVLDYGKELDPAKSYDIKVITRGGTGNGNLAQIRFITPQPTYTVTFNAGEHGTCTTTSLTETSAGAGVTLPSVTANTGYTFNGWATTSGATTADAGAADATYTPSADCTLYAVYTANQYSITYKDQGDADFTGTHASGYPTTHTYGTATTLDTPTKSGYTFGGYFTTSDCSGTAVTSLGATDYTAGITLYAKWEEITHLTVTFDGNGQTLAVSSLTQPTGGQAILLPAGYTSSEDVTAGTWHNCVTDADAGSTGTWATPDGDANYYEVFRSAYSDATGNVLTQTISGLDDNSYYEVVLDVAASATNSRDSYGCPTGNGLTVAFAGSGDNEKTVNIPVYDRTTVTSGAQNEVAFVVKPTDGSLIFGLRNIAASGNWFIAKFVSLKKITDASEFTGWYTAASGGTRVGGAGDAYTPTETTTLYAQWGSVSVTYDANGGSGTVTDATEYSSGATVTVLGNAFSKSEATFLSWNTKADGTGTTYYADNTFTITENTTLYAQWGNHTIYNEGTIGSTTVNDNIWWTAFSPYTTINKGETYRFSFKNHGGDANWYNYVLVGVNKEGHGTMDVDGYSEYFVLRADNYGWGTSYQTPGNCSYSSDWNTWKTNMASGNFTTTMDVNFTGTQFIMTATTTDGSTSYDYAFTSKEFTEASSAVLFFTVDHSYLTDYTANKVELVSGITLDKSNVALAMGSTTSTATVAATVAPTTAATKTLTWTSSDESVVTVAASGDDNATCTITRVGAGDATVTASATDGSGVSASCNVTVEAAATSPNHFTLTTTCNSGDLSLTPKTGSDITSAYATVTGGTAYVYNGHGTSTNSMVTKNYGVVLNGSGASYLKADLANYTLAEGDKITYTGDGSVYLCGTSSKATTISLSAGESYTVTSSDALNGKDSLYIFSNSSGHVKTLTIFTPVDVTAEATANDGAMGKVSLQDADGNTLSNPATVKSATTVQFVATPVDGYKFVNWTTTTTTDVVSTEATYSVVMNSDMLLTANFVEKSNEKTPLAGAGYTVSGTTITASAVSADAAGLAGQTLTLVLPEGASISAVSGASSTFNGNTISYTAPAKGGSATITVTIQAEDGTTADYTLTVSTSENSTETLYSTSAIATLSVDAGASNQEVGSENATTTGGSLYVYNGKDKAQSMVESTFFRISANNTFFKVQTDYAIKVGDVIEAKVRQESTTGRGLRLSTSSSYTTLGDMTLVTTGTDAGTYETVYYTVKTGDDIVGKTTFYLYRATGNTTQFQDFKITGAEATQISSDLAVSTTTVNVYVNTTTTPVDITSSSDATIKAVSGNANITVSVVDNQLKIVSSSATVTGAKVTITQDETTAYAGGTQTVTVNVVKYDMAAPVINYADKTVTITSEVEGATIYYKVSTDGGATWGDWTEYSDPFAITQTTVVKAYATASNYNDSPESDPVTCDYTIEYYNYTVNCVYNGIVLKTLKTGSAVANSSVTVAYPRFVLDGTTLREAAATDKSYNAPFTISANNQVCEIAYSKGSVKNVIYYAEAEDLEGFTKTTGNNASVRASQSAVAYSSGDVNIMDLVPGNYVIRAHATWGNSSTSSSTFKLGGTEAVVFTYSNNNWAYISQDIDLLEKKALTVSSAGGLDCFYIIQNDTLKVTEDGQKFGFTVENIDGTLFTTTNATTKSESYTKDDDVTGQFYMLKSTTNYVTIKEVGALSFEVKAFHGNGQATRYAKVYIDDATTAAATISIAPGQTASSGLISFDDNKTHTIKITGNGADVYPTDIIFYTKAHPATLMPTSTSVRALVTETVTLSSKATATSTNITMSTPSTDAAAVVTATFDNTTGTLTLTGVKEGEATLYFNITSDDTNIFANGTDVPFTVTVVKNDITLAYKESDNKKDYREFSVNARTTPSYSFTQPTLYMYAALGTSDSTAVTGSNKPSVTYTTTDATIAAVNASTGTITIPTNATGTAYITATSAETDVFNSSKTQFVVTIIRGYGWQYNTDSYTTGTKSDKDHLPEIGQQFIVTDGAETNPKTLLTGTFGGWTGKNSTHTYTYNGKSQIDSWQAGTNNVTAIDGYSNYTHGAYDASNEDMYNSVEAIYKSKIYGSARYGWYKTPDDDGTTYPFTLPVRGAYMTFEPTVNGTLTIYINQNGAWNTEKNDVTDNNGTVWNSATYTKANGTSCDTTGIKFPGSVPFQFRPHAFYIVDQDGVPMDSYTDFTIVTNTAVDTGLDDGVNLQKTIDNTGTKDKDRNTAKARLALLEKFCETYGVEKGEKFKCIIDETADGYNDATNIGNWTEFKEYMSKAEQERVHENWSSGVNGAQKITKLDNGAYLGIDEGMVKYTFYVAAHQTYYIFSNMSKLGFSGCNFVPDEEEASEPTAELALYDTKAYIKPTLVESGSDDTSEGHNTVVKRGGLNLPQYKSITLNRSFTADRWATICLPYSMTEDEVKEQFGEGTELIVLNGAELDGTNLHLKFIYHEIQAILTGYPYLIKPANTTSSVTVKNKIIKNSIAMKTLEFNGYKATGFADDTHPYSNAGVTNAKGVSGYSKNYQAGDIFISDGDGKLYISKGTSYGKGYRSFIEYAGEDRASAAKSISFDFSDFDEEDDDIPTGLEFAELEDEIMNMIKPAARGVYNLNGQKVADTTEGLPRGIYIVNGKKMTIE